MLGPRPRAWPASRLLGPGTSWLQRHGHALPLALPGAPSRRRSPLGMASDYLSGLDLPASDYSSDEDEGDISLDEGGPCLTYEALRLEGAGEERSVARFSFAVSAVPRQELVQLVYLPFTLPEEPGRLTALTAGLLNLGMVLLLWPWMSFAPRRLRVAACGLTAEQVSWWRWFYKRILTEWAVVNGRNLFSKRGGRPRDRRAGHRARRRRALGAGGGHACG
ncbi:unnamed protein product [Prorocentrum cordatum]|uniref:Uncharacterized protein n=1 Tax=Prorocentrum cordatum TaxID=2364126 RepID=A0ABN9WLI8_9DINO|nr:unnamed protein product [Polarella glacialis]